MEGREKGSVIPDGIRKRIGRWKKMGRKRKEGVSLGRKKLSLSIHHVKERMEAIRDCRVSVGHGGVHEKVIETHSQHDVVWMWIL
jgi:hypothetical protein